MDRILHQNFSSTLSRGVKGVVHMEGTATLDRLRWCRILSTDRRKMYFLRLELDFAWGTSPKCISSPYQRPSHRALSTALSGTVAEVSAPPQEASFEESQRPR